MWRTTLRTKARAVLDFVWLLGIQCSRSMALQSAYMKAYYLLATPTVQVRGFQAYSITTSVIGLNSWNF